MVGLVSFRWVWLLKSGIAGSGCYFGLSVGPNDRLGTTGVLGLSAF